jgi:acylphosphatase
MASREGLHGWVRNLPDGRVEICAEGEAEALERFERHVRHGPPGAKVDHVDASEEGVSGSDAGFLMR